MKKYNEQEMLDEFFEFVQAEPVAPSKDIDGTVTKLVAKDLMPAPMKVYRKFVLVQVFSGLLTLAVCPQFGLGLYGHNEFLHSLHTMTTPAIFYLFCGLLFVILGAGVSGLVLTHAEIRTVGGNKFLFFAIYSVLAFFMLVTLGAEVFILSSITWILGAFLGNTLGFEAVIRLRRVINNAR
jgi:hypothetical protein